MIGLKLMMNESEAGCVSFGFFYVNCPVRR